MPRLRLLLLLLCLLSFTFLNAQTISKIELLHNTNISQDFDYVTTLSDSLLHFYRIDNDSNSFTLKHWTCSPSGEFTIPTSIFTYTNSQPWGTAFPGYPLYSRNYGNLYIQFIVDGSLYYLTVSGVINVELDSFIDNSYSGFTLFTPGYLYYAKSIHYTQPLTIHRYNLISNVDDSLFTWSQLGDIKLLNIENKYLLMYGVYSNNLQNSIIIDSLNVDHPCSLTSMGQYPLNIQYMYINSKIADNIYLAGISDGLLRDGQFGFINITDFNISFYGLYSSCNMEGIPFEHYFRDVIPYGNGRFSCIDNTAYDGNLFSTWQFSGTDFDTDTGFPNLSQYAGPYSLQRINSRYGLGMSSINSSPRKFICIDYQSQTITDTTLAIANGSNYFVAKPMFAANTIYYVHQGTYPTYPRYLKIMKIIETTGATDPSQTFAIISHTAYPNPFLENTTISISLKQPETLSVSVYNLKGQLVRILISQGKAELTHELTWDGKSDNGTTSAAGLYIYKATTQSGQRISGKLMLLR